MSRSNIKAVNRKNFVKNTNLVKTKKILLLVVSRRAEDFLTKRDKKSGGNSRYGIKRQYCR